MTVRDVAAVTITVSAERMDALASAYKSAFGWNTCWSGLLDPALASIWGLQRGPRRSILIGPEGETRGLLRLVAGSAPFPPPLATFGWSAIEITVRNLDALAEQLRDQPEFRINGEAHDLRLSEGPPLQRTMQVVGPVGEQFSFTKVLSQSSEKPLAEPADGTNVGSVFVAVLAARDFLAARNFYTSALGMDCYLEGRIQLHAASAEMGLPEETTYRLAALRPTGTTRIEVNGYPPTAQSRRQLTGELPSGIGIVSLLVENLDAVLGTLRQQQYIVLGPPTPHDAPPYSGLRSTTIIGGTGELVEIIGP